MKHRRHHNNTGRRQIRSHKTVWQVQRIAQRLGIPFTFLRPGKRQFSGQTNAARTDPDEEQWEPELATLNREFILQP